MNLLYKRSTYWFLFAGTILMLGIMYVSGRPLTTPGTAGGILCLEFAGTGQEADHVLSTWRSHSNEKHDIVAAARVNTYLDFIFLFFYSLFLFTCCRRLATSIHGSRAISKTLYRASVAALLAGLLDILENAGMLQSLDAGGSDAVAMATSIFAAAKWILVSGVILVIIAGLIYRFLAGRRRG